MRYQAWKKDHGRQIRKGEKGIKIIAPCKYKVELEEKDDADRKIVIKSDMSQLQTIKTMIHEMAHEKLHAKEKLDKDHPVDRRTKEVEAESIAYTICQHYGLDSSDYSFSYVAGWSSGKEVKELKASLETIRSAADEMITSIDKALDKQAKREQARTARDEAR